MSDDPPHEMSIEELKQMLERFNAQVNGAPLRNYSMGRIGPEDDGDLAMAVAVDRPHKVIILRFGKPVEWIGLNVEHAEAVVNMLTEKIAELKGGG